jgi:ribosomal protein S18 acetylase RimI-like enzyme
VIALRPAGTADIDAIGRIWHAGWRAGHLGHVPEELHAHRGLDAFVARVPPRLGMTTVAEVGGAIAGFITVIDAELEQLYVAADARGTGLAAALLERAEQQIGERFEIAWLAVAAGNARARRFYERHGWHDAGALDYGAEVPGGTLAVACRRYERKLARPR